MGNGWADRCIQRPDWHLDTHRDAYTILRNPMNIAVCIPMIDH